jgi:hypothetical protein
MKTKQTAISEKGQHLNHPDDGFIIWGNLYASALDENGMPNKGIIGDSKTPKVLNDSGVKPLAYSVREFIQVLRIDPYLLATIAKEMIDGQNCKRTLEI